MPQKPILSVTFYWNFDSLKETCSYICSNSHCNKLLSAFADPTRKTTGLCLGVVFGLQCKIKYSPMPCIQTMYFKELQFCEVCILVIKFPFLMTERQLPQDIMHISSVELSIRLKILQSNNQNISEKHDFSVNTALWYQLERVICQLINKPK